MFLPSLRYVKRKQSSHKARFETHCGAFGVTPPTPIPVVALKRSRRSLTSIFGDASSCSPKGAHSHGVLPICCNGSPTCQCLPHSLNLFVLNSSFARRILLMRGSNLWPRSRVWSSKCCKRERATYGDKVAANQQVGCANTGKRKLRMLNLGTNEPRIRAKTV